MAKYSLITESQEKARTKIFLHLFPHIRQPGQCRRRQSSALTASAAFIYARLRLPRSLHELHESPQHHAVVRFGDLAGPCEKNKGRITS
jgi:hypothetical protein